MFLKSKYILIRLIEKYPKFEIFLYNNISKLKFLFPHEKDYLGIKLLFKNKHNCNFLDIGGNIGLSTIGFREMGFKKNRIYIFEPNNKFYNLQLKNLKKKYKKIKIFPFGLSNKDENKCYYKPYINDTYLHYYSSFDKNYLLNRLRENFPKSYKKIQIKTEFIDLKKFDTLPIKIRPSFVKIDVEGYDHLVLQGMKRSIKKFKPIFLIEYNIENFKKVCDVLGKFYDPFIYNISQNSIDKVSSSEKNKLKKGNKKNFKIEKIKIKRKNEKNLNLLSARNIFFIPRGTYKK